MTLILALAYFLLRGVWTGFSFPDPDGDTLVYILAWAAGREAFFVLGLAVIIGAVSRWGWVWWAALSAAGFAGAVQFVACLWPELAPNGLVKVEGMGNASMAGCFAVPAILLYFHVFEATEFGAWKLCGRACGAAPPRITGGLAGLVCGVLSTLLLAVRFPSSLPILAATAGTMVVAVRAAKGFLGLGLAGAFAVAISQILPYLDKNGASGRYQLYLRALRSWWKTGTVDRLFGIGPGALGVYIPLADAYRNGGTQLFPWLHSDGLGFLIEYGLVGFGLFTAAYGWLFIRTYRLGYTSLPCALAAYAVGLAFNFPLHYGWTWLLFAVLVGAAYREAKT